MSEAWNPLERLSNEQRQQLDSYGSLLLELNRRVNLVSREDEAGIFEHHILHSLTLSWLRFPAGATVVDWGAGGGLPSIPLAIAFPHSRFVAVDAVEKKVQAVRSIARRLGLQNLSAWHGRAEQYDAPTDYSVSRATAPLEELWSWHRRVARKGVEEGGCWRRGLVCLKGGDLTAEIEAACSRYPDLEVRSYSIRELLPGSYFEEKVILECTGADEPPPSANR